MLLKATEIVGRGFIGEFSKWGDAEHRKKRVMQSIGAAAVGIAAFSAVGKNLSEMIPVTQGTTLNIGDQRVIDIDLDLEKVCYTGFTTEVAATTKYSNKVGDFEWLWKSQTEKFQVATELCMDATTAKATLDKENHHITVHIDKDAITSDVHILPESIHPSSDMSPTAVPVENIMNVFKATPFLEDVGFIKDLTSGNDEAGGALAMAALVSGTKAVGDNCTSKVWPVVEPSFSDGVSNSVLLGARLYDKALTRNNTTILIGDAKSEEENAAQIVGKKTSVDGAYASLQDLRAKNNTLTVNNDTVGSCDVSQAVKDAALKGSAVKSAIQGDR